MMKEIREAIILAGGFGTRLAEAVPDICKPMAPVAGRPFLRYILDQLAESRFDRVIIADGYKREQIESYFGFSYRGMVIGYSPETTPLGTGGAVKRALEMCVTDWVYVLNGDTYFDVDFLELERFAAEREKCFDVLIAVKPMEDFDRYGTIEFDDSGTVNGFFEKKSLTKGFINSGVYFIKRNILQTAPSVFSLEKDFFERECPGGRVGAVVLDGTFIDIGIPDDYKRAQGLLAPLSEKNKIAFFDRDGTINEDTGHLFEPEKLRLIPEALDILRSYSNDPNWRVVVVTNQAGIAKGIYSERQMRLLHHFLDSVLSEQGIKIDAYYYCPHHPHYTGECTCRKPAPGLFLQALRDYDAKAEDCVMYGDKITDIEAASAAGVLDCFLVNGR